MKTLILFLFAGLLIFDIKGQENKFDIAIHGFVEVDAQYDSRESKTARHRHILLYPYPDAVYSNGVAVPRRGEFNIGAGISRFSIHVKGPVVNGITTFAMMEGDFTGGLPGTDSDFLLRHAYMMFGYSKVSLIVGQTWHPLFIPENFPQTLNAGAGVPIHPLCRNAQLRFIWKPSEKIELSSSFIEQSTFKSSGFTDGSEESKRPEISLQLKAGGNGPLWASLTAGYKTLAVPYSIDSISDASASGSYYYSASVRYKIKGFVFRAGTIYGGNLTEHVMPGGVGRVKSSSDDNPKYKSQYTGSYWVDMAATMKNWNPGLFAGYLKNYGASEEINVISDLSRDPNIGDLIVITPRMKYLIGQHAYIGLEYIFTRAGYGSSYTEKGKPVGLKNYINHRTMLSFRFTF